MSNTIKQKTKIQIIEETAKHYSVKNRAVAGNQCRYLIEVNSEIRECAVGRCLADSRQFEHQYYGVMLAWPTDGSFNLILKPEYQGHERFFWESIQLLHDSYDNWNNDGLTEQGEKDVAKIIERHQDNNLPKKELTGDV